MPSNTFYKGLSLPTVAGDTGIWGGELNTTITSVDAIIGATVTLFSSTVGTNVTPSSSQSLGSRITVNNTSTTPFQLNLPASNGFYGQFNINYASGAGVWCTVTAGASGTGGANTLIGPNTQRQVFVDGFSAVNPTPQLAGLSFSTDGVFSAPQPGQKPKLVVPFNFVATSWVCQSDGAGATGNWTATVFGSGFGGTPYNGAGMTTGGATPTISGGTNSGSVAGWAITSFTTGAEIVPSLNSPANFTKSTFTILGGKA
jgi:hypothetical protein